MLVTSRLLSTGLALLGAWGLHPGGPQPSSGGLPEQETALPSVQGPGEPTLRGAAAGGEDPQAALVRWRRLAAAGDGRARLWLLEHDLDLALEGRLALARDLVREHAHEPTLLLPRFPRLLSEDRGLGLEDVGLLLRGLAELAEDPELAGQALLALAERTAPLACEEPDAQEAARTLCREVGRRWPRTRAAREAAATLWRLQHLAVGRTAPEFLARDARGNQLASEDLRGEVVVVHVWRFEGPGWGARTSEERRLRDRFWDERFTWLGVNLDRDREAFVRTCEDRGMQWTQHAWEGGTERPVCEAWQVGERPLLVLLDAEGVIRGIDLEPRELESRIAALLRELRQAIESRDPRPEEGLLGGR